VGFDAEQHEHGGERDRERDGTHPRPGATASRAPVDRRRGQVRAVLVPPAALRDARHDEGGEVVRLPFAEPFADANRLAVVVERESEVRALPLVLVARHTRAASMDRTSETS